MWGEGSFVRNWNKTMPRVRVFTISTLNLFKTKTNRILVFTVKKI